MLSWGLGVDTTTATASAPAAHLGLQPAVGVVLPLQPLAHRPQVHGALDDVEVRRELGGVDRAPEDFLPVSLQEAKPNKPKA
jgi:hypothetical protein